MLPPPAPSEVTATLGVSTGWPAISSWLSTSAAPSTTSETSNDVPPMSTQISRPEPTSRATATAAIVPPTGPEKSVLAARRTTSDADVTPPFDCITRSGRARPCASAARRAARGSRRSRASRRRDDGRRPALVLAPLRRDLVRADDDEAGRLLAHELAPRAARAPGRRRRAAGRRRPRRARPPAPRAASRTAASSSGSSTEPSAARRPATSTMSRRRSSIGGRRQWMSYISGRFARPIS